MFGNVDPKKIQGMMSKMGIKQEEIDAKRVIIEKDNGNIIIENPNVAKISMSGNVSFQVTGDIKEEVVLSQKEPKEDESREEDIKTVMQKTGKTRLEAEVALNEANGDLAEAILALS